MHRCPNQAMWFQNYDHIYLKFSVRLVLGLVKLTISPCLKMLTNIRS